MRVRNASALAGCVLLLATACAKKTKPPATAAEPPASAASGAPPKPAARTVEDVLRTIGPEAEKRLRAHFAGAGVAYPPKQVHLLAFKDERKLELWAAAGGVPRRVALYPLTDSSGELGPKLREGDYQIPEGTYRISLLNPNSQYHLSMKLDYPNAFDREQAKRDGRTALGGDIFIHGDEHTIGCLAIGDPAIEELFVLTARIGMERVKTIVAPVDLRHRPAPDLGERALSWVPMLYAQLTRALAPFR
jgi:hypothetical protein